jgi:hypothetical protein
MLAGVDKVVDVMRAASPKCKLMAFPFELSGGRCKLASRYKTEHHTLTVLGLPWYQLERNLQGLLPGAHCSLIPLQWGEANDSRASDCDTFDFLTVLIDSRLSPTLTHTWSVSM